MGKKYMMLVLMGWICLIFTGMSAAADPPTAQRAGGIAGREEQRRQQEDLQRRITAERIQDQAADVQEEDMENAGPEVMIRTIRVEDYTLLTEDEVRSVTAEYEGQKLTLKDMQKIADLLTARYREKGFVTSRAYLPPQDLQSGVLVIRVVEGRLGEVDIRGNEHFRTDQLREQIGLKSQGYFDYSALQKSLVYINEHPDRTARAVLVPGGKPGTTDVVLEVDDRLPFHAGVSYDNWGSRFIDEDRYALILEHNNLTGHDDKMYFKGQLAENQQLTLGLLRYVYPVDMELEIGAYALYSKVRSGDEFAALDAEGEAAIYGLFLTQNLYETENAEVRANAGFDYKSIEDTMLGAQLSRDELRVVKGGLDFDISDRWGRSILVTEVDRGIPDILGGMAAEDPHSSRGGAGSGAEFTKGIVNLFRLQPMPWETALLWKNYGQFSNDTLVASEEFQIGGPTSVRGYPPAEFSGDKGWYTALELSIPVYPIPRDAGAPFSKDRLYDALRLVLFWDWAYAQRNRPDAGEKEKHTLQGAGFGLRYNVTEDLDFRLEIGYPLSGPTPSDGDHMHPWVEFSYKW
ncbi:MAG: ShlB/FhaC/HecB family hemolysin secretion/activation protein [Candidatus Omnitrophota bacterium]